MKDNDIRKLSRTEILELLIEQTKENETLEKKIEERDHTIDELRKQLEDRRIVLENAGSIAEASLRLNYIFEAAQSAADEYLENVRMQYEKQMKYANTAEAETALKIQQMEAQAQKTLQETQLKVQQLLHEAHQRCDLLESETAQKCEEMTQRAKRESQEYWDQVSARLGGLMKQRPHAQVASDDKTV